VDEESRRVAMDSAKAIDEAARHRTVAAGRRRRKGAVSSPALGLTMLGLIVIAIMMGFPTAFTLMGLGMIFGYVAFLTPDCPGTTTGSFDLIVQRTYGVMTNDTLLSSRCSVHGLRHGKGRAGGQDVPQRAARVSGASPRPWRSPRSWCARSGASPPGSSARWWS